MSDLSCVPIEAPFVSTGFFLKGGTLKAPLFQLEFGSFSPLHTAPWVNSPTEKVDGRLGNLQGDFFCCPFGGNGEPVDGLQHPLHGFCAHEEWVQLDRAGAFKFAKGDLIILKEVVPGQDHPAIYQKHTLSGKGKVCYGQHVMLQTGGQGVTWWTSPFHHGQVFPDVFEGAETQGRQSLQPGGRFKRLDWVPGQGGKCHDISRRPHTRGTEDLCQIFQLPGSQFAWHAALYPGSPSRLWVSIKSVKTLPSTVIWMSEGGRDYAPWSGRHTGVLALEDTCSHFHYGLAESIKADRADRRTCADLDKGPVVTKSGMTCLEVPFDFNKVLDVKVREGFIEIITDTEVLAAKFDTEFFSETESEFISIRA